jgi:hypothetical protein
MEYENASAATGPEKTKWGARRGVIFLCSAAFLLAAMVLSCSTDSKGTSSTESIDSANVPHDSDLTDDTATYNGPSGTMLAATALSSPVLAALVGQFGQTDRSSLSGLSVGALEKAVANAYAVGVDLSGMTADSAARDPLIQTALRLGTPLVFENTAALASYLASQTGLSGLSGLPGLPVPTGDTAAVKAAREVMAAAMGLGVQSQITIAMPPSLSDSSFAQIFCLGAGVVKTAFEAGTLDSSTAILPVDSLPITSTILDSSTGGLDHSIQASTEATPVTDPAALMALVKSTISQTQALSKRNLSLAKRNIALGTTVASAETSVPALVTKKEFVIKYPEYAWYPADRGQDFVIQVGIRVQLFVGKGGQKKWVRLIADDLENTTGFYNRGRLIWSSDEEYGYFQSDMNINFTSTSGITLVDRSPGYVDGGPGEISLDPNSASPYSPRSATSTTSFDVDYVENGVNKTWTSTETRQFHSDEYEIETWPGADWRTRLMMVKNPFRNETMRLDRYGTYEWWHQSNYSSVKGNKWGDPMDMARGRQQTGFHPKVQATYSVPSSQTGSGTFTMNLCQRAYDVWFFGTSDEKRKRVIGSGTLSKNITVDFGNLTARSALWAAGTYGNPGATISMQKDGNLVISNSAGTPIWASHTDGNPGAYKKMQSDGNLVIYSSSGNAIWASNTYGNPGAYDVLQSDGNYVIYSKK